MLFLASSAMHLCLKRLIPLVMITILGMGMPHFCTRCLESRFCEDGRQMLTMFKLDQVVDAKPKTF